MRSQQLGISLLRHIIFQPETTDWIGTISVWLHRSSPSFNEAVKGWIQRVVRYHFGVVGEQIISFNQIWKRSRGGVHGVWDTSNHKVYAVSHKVLAIFLRFYSGSL